MPSWVARSFQLAPVPLGLWVAVEALRRCAEAETIGCAEALLHEGLSRTEIAPAHGQKPNPHLKRLAAARTDGSSGVPELMTPW